jgi:short-chain fatty acids transporter
MKKLINFFTRLCEAYLPDALVFSFLLTIILFVSGLIFTPSSPIELAKFWGRDFWSLNAFAMQMVFVLISGHMLASTPLIKRVLNLLISRVRNESQGLVVVSIFSVIACWINWGFGLIVSGILAVEMARKLKKVNFGLFLATAYAGFLVWHGGLSGSIPLKIAEGDEILKTVFPGLSIPLNQTIFSMWNLIIVLVLLLGLPLFALWMRTDEKDNVLINEEELKTEEAVVQNFRGFNILFFMLILIAIFNKDSVFDINKVNAIFLALALLLHKTPRLFLKALQDSIGYASGIVIQFPFYAGIMGLMQHSGLADQLSEVFVSISTASTLPLWTFLSGGIVNFFIPSGGGQWVVQGPIMLKAARDLAADPAKVSMALAWGDAWTNLIQPFWALPLLGLAKLKLKDIMGYCLIYLFFSGVVISVVLILS